MTVSVQSDVNLLPSQAVDVRRRCDAAEPTCRSRSKVMRPSRSALNVS